MFEELVEVIREELSVCYAIGRFDLPDGVGITSALIADVVWRNFELGNRPIRTPDRPD